MLGRSFQSHFKCLAKVQISLRDSVNVGPNFLFVNYVSKSVVEVTMHIQFFNT